MIKIVYTCLFVTTASMLVKFARFGLCGNADNFGFGSIRFGSVATRIRVRFMRLEHAPPTCTAMRDELSGRKFWVIGHVIGAATCRL